jgi:hypothetical protein
MNANELADLIERCNDCGYNQDAANMLRQMGLAESIIAQQKLEIKTLEKEVKLWQEQAVAHRAGLGFKFTGEIRQWTQE